MWLRSSDDVSESDEMGIYGFVTGSGSIYQFRFNWEFKRFGLFLDFNFGLFSGLIELKKN